MASSSSAPRSVPPPDSNVVAQVSVQNEPPPAIFLSYSRHQKDFVEKLYVALVRAGHRPFLDRVTLPVGAQLSEYIDRYVRGCSLGVVVLSSDYVTSKWPMLELVIMSETRSVDICPLFYKLKVDDLEDPDKLSEWRQQWRNNTANNNSVDERKWEKSVRSLHDLIGKVFPPNSDESVYIDTIVAAINMKIPPFINYDVSYVKGHDRFIKVIEGRFDRAKNVDESSLRPCAIGLHGVGGTGKTTLCQVMVNFYQLQYSGKCLYMEFPTKEDKESVLEQCKKILRRFFGMDETLIGQVDNFNQAMDLMKKQMKSQQVFLALDNVWEHSLEQAKRILNVGFAPESRVLVTSRSEAVLKEVLQGCEGTCVGCVPSMDRKEALETLQQASCGKDLCSLDPESLLYRILELCLLEDAYHPLLLEALGRRLRKIERSDDFKVVAEKLSRRKFSSQESRIEGLIRINFDVVPSIRQRVFLDVAVTCRAASVKELRVRALLRIWYEGHDVDDLLEQLTLDGLLRIEGDKVVIHDLYLELAQREADSSGRFLVREFMNIEMVDIEMVDWAKLEKIVLFNTWAGPPTGIDLVHDCPNLQVLIVGGDFFLRGLRLESMRSLLVMAIDFRQSGEITGLSAAGRLVMLHARFFDGRRPFRTADVGTLTRLRILDIEIVGIGTENEGRHLRGCRSLKVLLLTNYWLDDGDYLPAFRNIRTLTITGDDASVDWKKFPDLRGLRDLKCLTMSGFGSLEEIADVPSKLQHLTLQRCPSLKRLLVIRTLDQLEVFRIEGCESLEEIGALSSNIRELVLHQCCLKELLFDGQSLTRLKHLESIDSTLDCSNSRILQKWERWQRSLVELSSPRKLPVATQLQYVRISSCPSLEEISWLPLNLDSLSISCCSSLQKIGEFAASLDIDDDHSPKRLKIDHRDFLPKIPQLPSGLLSLRIEGPFHPSGLARRPKYLSIATTCRVKEIGELSSEIQELHISKCGSLQEIGKLSSGVQRLYISKCGSLQEIRDLPSGIQEFHIENCGSLQEIRDLPSGIQKFHIKKCGSLQEIRECPSQVSICRVEKCASLEKFPSTSGLARLNELNILDCGALREIGEFSSGIHYLTIRNCASLEKFPSTSGLARLDMLDISNCESLREMGEYSSGIDHLSIGGCKLLQDMPDFPSDLRFLGFDNFDMVKGIWKCPSNVKELIIENCKFLEGISEFPLTWKRYGSAVAVRYEPYQNSRPDCRTSSLRTAVI